MSRAAGPLTTRAEILAAEEATKQLLPQEELYSGISAKMAEEEQLLRDKKRAKEQHMQIEDAIHVAKHGKEPPKFPEITVSS